MKNKIIVISAVNFTEGGPLNILLACLKSASLELSYEWRIIALVNNAELFHIPRVEVLEFPLSKKSWFYRLWLEWYYFKKLSLTLYPDLWFSLHDITPRVNAKRQVVYCHNPSPFYKPQSIDFFLDPIFFFTSRIYIFVYRLFINRNFSIIVQQNWLRVFFYNKFSHNNIIVSHPIESKSPHSPKFFMNIFQSFNKRSKNKLKLFYPALPRVFKNFEVICDALSLLPSEFGSKIELSITISGSENLYSKFLYKKYSQYSNIFFVGYLNKIQINEHYNNCDIVVFPSRLETWGLPISEAKILNKPLLVADLPYAHETVGDYNQVAFIPYNDPIAWSNTFLKILNNSFIFSDHKAQIPADPYTSTWKNLWPLLINDL
jgi:glycosyltransferase involved in cell wall biosynthesis